VDPRRFFSESECEAIAAAAREAEGCTSGEIVPYVVGSCDDYSETWWKAAVLGALAGGFGGVALHNIVEVWGGSLWHWVILPAVVVAIAGASAARWSEPFRRFLVADQILDLRARQRAAVAFLEEELFATRDRTGILIFLALFEHRVVVLGDDGINRAVPDGAWEHVVEDLVAGIKARKPARALVEAIAECGRLLDENRLEIRPDDTDELPNQLRIRER
jgi:putative membrane protein